MCLARRSTVALAVSLLALAGCQSDVALGGPNTLVRVDHVTNGPDCPTGGVAIQTGLDQDGDTFLDDDEITSTQFVCNGSTAVACSGGNVLTGTIAVRTTGDWDQLAGVDCIDGELLIAGVTAAGIPALPDLQIITGDLVIAGNPSLSSLDGLDHVREIGGGYFVQSNDALTDVSALAQVKRSNSIQLIGNDALTDLAGLEPFVDIGTVLVIANNANLTSLAGLDNLRTTTKTLSIRANPKLASIAALDGLRQAQLLEVSGNDALETLSLGSLQKIDARLVVTANDALTEVSLPALSTVGDFARFGGDPLLTAIDLPSLLTIGSLLVTTDSSLASLRAPGLVFATVQVQLVDLPRLTVIQLDKLTSIGDSLSLATLPLLADLSGFAALHTIGGAFSVQATASLHDFTGLGALETVSGTMMVANNAQLRSFTGLTRMREVDGDLTITGNPMLPRATSQAFAQHLTVHGTVTVN
jgi:hypothetical protein